MKKIMFPIRKWHDNIKVSIATEGLDGGVRFIRNRKILMWIVRTVQVHYHFNSTGKVTKG